MTDDRHGAVLNDGVSFVSCDHSDVEKTTIFGVAHRLERILVIVPIILRRLNDRDAGCAERRHEILKPLGRDTVVTVDDRNGLSIRPRVAKREIERAGLEACEGAHVEKAETRSQC